MTASKKPLTKTCARCGRLLPRRSQHKTECATCAKGPLHAAKTAATMAADRIAYHDRMAAAMAARDERAKAAADD